MKRFLFGILIALFMGSFFTAFTASASYAAVKKPGYQVISTDGDFTVIKQQNKYGALYQKKPWLPIVYDRIVVGWEPDNQFYIIAQKGKAKQLFFKPKQNGPYNVTETGNGNIEIVRGMTVNSYHPYIVINDYEKKKVTLLQLYTNKTVFSLPNTNLVFQPANMNEYEVFTFYNYVLKTYSIKKTTDFASLAESLKLPFIPASTRLVKAYNDHEGTKSGKRYLEFANGTNRLYYDTIQKKMISIPGSVEDTTIFADEGMERLVVSFKDKNKQGKLYVDGISTPYDLFPDRGMMVNATDSRFFGTNSAGKYGAIDIATGQIVLPFDYQLLDARKNDGPYINSKKQLLFVPYPYSRYMVYDENIQTMYDNYEFHYKVRANQAYWIVNRDGKKLMNTSKEAVLVPALKVDGLGRETSAKFGVKDAGKITYYYHDIYKTKQITIYSKEELLFNTLNVYLSNVYREFTQYDNFYYFTENNKLYLSNKDRQKLDQQAYTNFYPDYIFSTDYVIAIIKHNETFDLYTKEGKKINTVGPLQYFVYRDIKSDYHSPYDTSQIDAKRMVVKSGGKLYEIKNDQMIPFVK